MQQDILLGKNAVMEAIKAGRPIDTVFIAESAGGLAGVIRAAKQAGAVVKQTDAKKLDSYGEHHQGVVAVVAAAAYVSLEELLQAARAKGEPPFLVLCDEIEDPHNLGALIRTAEAAGAHGLVLPKRRSASLTPVVSKTSAGAVSVLPVARVSNLSACIDRLKKEGVWVYCADMDGQSWCGCDLTGGIALVVGSEGRGVSRLVREKCDGVLSLPMCGQINSLNASVAGGILLYEILRQRQGIAAKNPKR